MNDFFLTTAAQAYEFYERCEKANANTEEERLKIMADMVRERKMFKQTPEQVKKRIQGKKVLRVRRKPV